MEVLTIFQLKGQKQLGFFSVRLFQVIKYFKNHKNILNISEDHNFKNQF